MLCHGSGTRSIAVDQTGQSVLSHLHYTSLLLVICLFALVSLFVPLVCVRACVRACVCVCVCHCVCSLWCGWVGVCGGGWVGGWGWVCDLCVCNECVVWYVCVVCVCVWCVILCV